MAGFFGFLDFTKEGPGVKKDGPKKKAFFVFFEMFFRNFWRFITINFVFVCLSLPIITSGMASAGLTNVTRNIARDKHSFGLSDFFETIKKNFKRALAVGIINTIVTAIIGFAIFIYYKSCADPQIASVFNRLGLWISMMVAGVFLMMQFYIFTLMITFNFNVKALYVNSFKFVIINLWRNLLCGIILILVYVLYYVVFALSGGSVAVLLSELLVAALTLPAFQYLLIQFFTFGSIKKYIIDPYYKEHPEEGIEQRRSLGIEVPEDDTEAEEPISWE